jgi:hypothetical protein
VVVRTERPLAQVAAQCAAVAFVVVLASVPLYVWVEPSWRGLVARAASALVLGVALLQLRRLLTDRLEADGPWPLDEARRRPRSERAVPHHFRDLASDVRAALRSRRYFEQGLWPRLTALAARPLARPRLRPGRGPSLAGLRRVVADIEEER